MARNSSTRAGKTALLAPADWLHAVLDPRSRLQFRVCRYHHKRLPWANVHRDPDEHFVTYVERGSFLAEVQGRSVRAESGGLLWLGPGHSKPIHGDPSQPDLRHINLRFRLTRGRQVLGFQPDLLLLPRALASRAVFDELLSYHEDPGPHPDPRLRGLLLSLATTCFALDAGGGADEGLQAHHRRHLQRFLAEHLHRAIGPAELAAELDLSLDYFSRRFRRSYGSSPRRYLVEERMRAAALRLIESEDPVAAIGRQVGVTDANLFTRQFRSVIGCTPLAYRQRGHEPETSTERKLEV